MFSKLRQNYRLSNILIRIAFVLAYVLYSWQTWLASAQLVKMQFGSAMFLSDSMLVAIALTSSALVGVALMFLLPLFVNLFLNVSKFHNVPRAEFTLLVHLFFVLFYFVCGSLELFNLLTPLLINWGGRLFELLVSAGCVIWFYDVTSKLYFNDVTNPYYFRNLAIVYLACAFLFGVLL